MPALKVWTPRLQVRLFGLFGRKSSQGGPNGAVCFFAFQLVHAAERDEVGKIAGFRPALLAAANEQGLVADHP